LQSRRTRLDLHLRCVASHAPTDYVPLNEKSGRRRVSRRPRRSVNPIISAVLHPPTPKRGKRRSARSIVLVGLMPRGHFGEARQPIQIVLMLSMCARLYILELGLRANFLTSRSKAGPLERHMCGEQKPPSRTGRRNCSNLGERKSAPVRWLCEAPSYWAAARSRFMHSRPLTPRPTV